MKIPSLAEAVRNYELGLALLTERCDTAGAVAHFSAAQTALALRLDPAIDLQHRLVADLSAAAGPGLEPQ